MQFGSRSLDSLEMPSFLSDGMKWFKDASFNQKISTLCIILTVLFSFVFIVLFPTHDRKTEVNLQVMTEDVYLRNPNTPLYATPYEMQLVPDSEPRYISTFEGSHEEAFQIIGRDVQKPDWVQIIGTESRDAGWVLSSQIYRSGDPVEASLFGKFLIMFLPGIFGGLIIIGRYAYMGYQASQAVSTNVPILQQEVRVIPIEAEVAQTVPPQEPDPTEVVDPMRIWNQAINGVDTAIATLVSWFLACEPGVLDEIRTTVDINNPQDDRAIFEDGDVATLRNYLEKPFFKKHRNLLLKTAPVAETT